MTRGIRGMTRDQGINPASNNNGDSGFDRLRIGSRVLSVTHLHGHFGVPRMRFHRRRVLMHQTYGSPGRGFPATLKSWESLGHDMLQWNQGVQQWRVEQLEEGAGQQVAQQGRTRGSRSSLVALAHSGSDLR